MVLEPVYETAVETRMCFAGNVLHKIHCVILVAIMVPVSHAIMSFMKYYGDIIAYAIMSCPPDAFAYAIVSVRTLLHNALCPPDAVVSAPVQNRSCSKLNALGRRNTFDIFFVQDK